MSDQNEPVDPREESVVTAQKLYELFGEDALGVATRQLEKSVGPDQILWRAIVRALLEQSFG